MFNERTFTLGPKTQKRKFVAKNEFKVKNRAFYRYKSIWASKRPKSIISPTIGPNTLYLIQNPKTFSFTVSSDNALLTSY